ncbi:unnamed protein product [Polarella glacialis]|uniref:Peptidylprolyl isomerase n=1 Tax=Polarella glacialis TaxID=89957 RepID=A0A813IH17_POLGL|nr:unnamed protein product [Polarella glacialis]CAE8649925.1 unnamed protein product [Polarella glacialis]
MLVDGQLCGTLVSSASRFEHCLGTAMSDMPYVMQHVPTDDPTGGEWTQEMEREVKQKVSGDSSAQKPDDNDEVKAAGEGLQEAYAVPRRTARVSRPSLDAGFEINSRFESKYGFHELEVSDHDDVYVQLQVKDVDMEGAQQRWPATERANSKHQKGKKGKTGRVGNLEAEENSCDSAHPHVEASGLPEMAAEVGLHTSGAEEDVKVISKDMDKAAEFELLEYDKTDAQVQYEADLEKSNGNVASRNGHWQQANKHWKAALRGAEKLGEFELELRLRLNLVLSYLRQGKTAKALEHCEQVLKERLKSAASLELWTKAHYRTAEVYEATGKISKAFASLRYVLMIEPANADARRKWSQLKNLDAER